MVKICEKCGSKKLVDYCPNCDFEALEHEFVVKRYLQGKINESMERVI